MDRLPSRLQDLTKDELIEKILESETILNEFQESSKELEKALEQELQDLELSNQNLQTQNRNLKNQNNSIIQTNSENGKQIDNLQEILRNKSEEIHTLRQQIVKIEITNDSMENQDRIIQNALNLQKNFNNDLLEKIAILEDEIDRSRKQNFEKQLYITNYQSQIKELNSKIENLESKIKDIETVDTNDNKVNEYNGDVSFVTMEDMLKSTPPPNKLKELQQQQSQRSKLKKSDSLQKLKSLTRDIEMFLGNFNRQVHNNDHSSNERIALYKSPSTTHITKINNGSSELIGNTTDQKRYSINSSKRISLSKRFSDLPSISGSPTSIKRVR
ncbi:hypothetical protein KGF54_004146 [Candida jiufengensis]|uniref:uncharacterized protein n=1 Tax=Candida jiufengensis TaxID=497108 RepID=UPI0022258216|nr:uncharacterized protein KGF54_004146 [Candida jiufengensis]KAI5951072.1 hypothetical protein KGF54_004146 [Candida jiufengensis]